MSPKRPTGFGGSLGRRPKKPKAIVFSSVGGNMFVCCFAIRLFFVFSWETQRRHVFVHITEAFANATKWEIKLKICGENIMIIIR